MSQKRQTAIFDPLGDRHSQITTLTHDYPAGHVVPSHFHDRDQLVYASRGVMTVRTGEGTWVVPTQRAVWIPAAIPHTITMSGTVAMRTLYLKARLARNLPRDCCVVNVPALLKDLILNACTSGALRKTIKWQGHLICVIVDQLEAIQMVPLQLPNPSDPRARRVAAVLLADPSDRRPLAHICKVAGASKRTVETLPGGRRDDLWQVAPTTSPHAGDAAFGGRSQSHARCSGIGLQHTERIHFHVQEIIGNHSGAFLWNGLQTGACDAIASLLTHRKIRPSDCTRQQPESCSCPPRSGLSGHCVPIPRRPRLWRYKRSNEAKRRARTTNIITLASGPTEPPVSHCGP